VLKKSLHMVVASIISIRCPVKPSHATAAVTEFLIHPMKSTPQIPIHLATREQIFCNEGLKELVMPVYLSLVADTKSRMLIVLVFVHVSTSTYSTLENILGFPRSSTLEGSRFLAFLTNENLNLFQGLDTSAHGCFCIVQIPDEYTFEWQCLSS